MSKYQIFYDDSDEDSGKLNKYNQNSEDQWGIQDFIFQPFGVGDTEIFIDEFDDIQSFLNCKSLMRKITNLTRFSQQYAQMQQNLVIEQDDDFQPYQESQMPPSLIMKEFQNQSQSIIIVNDPNNSMINYMDSTGIQDRNDSQSVAIELPQLPQIMSRKDDRPITDNKNRHQKMKFDHLSHQRLERILKIRNKAKQNLKQQHIYISFERNQDAINYSQITDQEKSIEMPKIEEKRQLQKSPDLVSNKFPLNQMKNQSNCSFITENDAGISQRALFYGRRYNNSLFRNDNKQITPQTNKQITISDNIQRPSRTELSYLDKYSNTMEKLQQIYRHKNTKDVLGSYSCSQQQINERNCQQVMKSFDQFSQRRGLVNNVKNVQEKFQYEKILNQINSIRNESKQVYQLNQNRKLGTERTYQKNNNFFINKQQLFTNRRQIEESGTRNLPNIDY
ncbi:UNKNOWN [Stylonychia lemnae]|uniref:Uncharacterized protein n=1 Tax=Stylonychia lemnae TaxID=5949 RepID=A0A078BBG5_STYLE|nr:UNKNOWN [Stylonychia lemnae]|eukprot:CDW91556.1 UNKNOWN [Stylonychia lemnae]